LKSRALKSSRLFYATPVERIVASGFLIAYQPCAHGKTAAKCGCFS
jgi:hypothetical protein